MSKRLAYVLILLAALLRVALPLIAPQGLVAWLWAAALAWSAGCDLPLYLHAVVDVHPARRQGRLSNTPMLIDAIQPAAPHNGQAISTDSLI